MKSSKKKKYFQGLLTNKESREYDGYYLKKEVDEPDPIDLKISSIEEFSDYSQDNLLNQRFALIIHLDIKIPNIPSLTDLHLNNISPSISSLPRPPQHTSPDLTNYSLKRESRGIGSRI